MKRFVVFWFLLLFVHVLVHGKEESIPIAGHSSNRGERFRKNYEVIGVGKEEDVIAETVKALPQKDTIIRRTIVSNRRNGFTRADTLRGKLTALRSNYDVTFYHLDVTIDLEKRSVKGNNIIRFKVQEPFTKMQIDLYENMKIDSILYKDQQLPYTREHSAVFITFPDVLRLGMDESIKVYYEGIPKTPVWEIPMNGGVLWDKDSLGSVWAQMVCQGSGASVWWPNKDHLSDEPDSMRIWITVPSGYTEISNGRLIKQTDLPDNKTRYEWAVSYPINNYNVTFNIGKYYHFTDLLIAKDTLRIDYYVMPYHVKKAKRMFQQVKPMLSTFEKYFGEYPFKKDGFTLVESLYPMEHQSGVCIGRIDAETSEDANRLMWHEVAHEWWGNAVSCKDMADLWIHEAFATYAETLILEDRFGKEEALQARLDQMRAVIGEEPVIGVYDVNHIHYDISDMYSKGCLMLNTFRNVLNNDQMWIKLLSAIQEEFRYQTLTSDQLITFINNYTKADYTYLFDQYLRYVNLPVLEIKLQQKDKNLFVNYRWKADVKGFRMPVRITKGVGKFDFIFPIENWQSLTLKNISEEDFEVDEEGFYIHTHIQ